MVEVTLDQAFLDQIAFKDERGNMRKAPLQYEWKPTGQRQDRERRDSRSLEEGGDKSSSQNDEGEGHDTWPNKADLGSENSEKSMQYQPERSRGENSSKGGEDVKTMQKLTAIQKEIQQHPHNSDLIKAKKEAYSEHAQRHKVHMQHVWAPVTKQDNLWIKWVHSVYLKGQEWWDYIPPKDRSWYWEKINEVKQKIMQHISMNEIKNMKNYQLSRVYNKMEDDIPDFAEARNVWSRHNIPKHSLNCWVAAHGRLPTADRLDKMGANIDKNCKLCLEAEETSSHLFFKCKYAQERLAMLKDWLSSRNQANNLSSLFRWMNRRGKASKAKQFTWNAMTAAMVYTVWHARNCARLGLRIPNIQIQVGQIKFQVRQKLNVMHCRKLSQKDRLWLEKIM
ncbi:hypothetical protein RDABS01_021581 [Bienertia sinuspersici]